MKNGEWSILLVTLVGRNIQFSEGTLSRAEREEKKLFSTKFVWHTKYFAARFFQMAIFSLSPFPVKCFLSICFRARWEKLRRKKTHMQTIKLKMLDVKVELRRRKKMEQHQTREKKQQLKHAQDMR